MHDSSKGGREKKAVPALKIAADGGTMEGEPFSQGPRKVCRVKEAVGLKAVVI